MSTLQTLDRGIAVLELIARSPAGVNAATIAEHLGVHRAIAYRIIATLEAHHLIWRSHDGRFRLGAGVTTLARGFAPQLMERTRPVLRELADATGATAFMSVAEGEECVVVMVVEGRERSHGLRVSYREGTRHSIRLGAPGLSILAARPAQADEPAEVAQARDLGYSLTKGQLQAGAVGVSVGFLPPPALAEVIPDASVGVVALADLDEEVAVRASKAAAEQIRAFVAGAPIRT